MKYNYEEHMTTIQVIELAHQMGVPCSPRTIIRWRRGYYSLPDGKKKWYTKEHLRIPFGSSYNWKTNKGYTYSKGAVVGWLKTLKDQR